MDNVSANPKPTAAGFGCAYITFRNFCFIDIKQIHTTWKVFKVLLTAVMIFVEVFS
jgi:hypothetical protein